MITLEEKTKRAAEIQDEMRHFTGTETWFRHSLMRKVLYTEGVQYLAEKAEAYWLVDKIAAMQLERKIKAEPFQVWRLKVNTTIGDAVLTCDDGGKPGDVHDILYSEHIHFTDFPLDEIELWVEQGGDGTVILLPSEH